MDVYNRIGLDAFTPGPLDLLAGMDTLVAARERATFPFLLANLVDLKTGQPVFERFALVGKGKVTFGLFGLISESLAKEFAAEQIEGYAITNPVTAAREIMAAIGDKADLIVCLAELGREGERELAESVEGIDLIIGGHVVGSHSPPSERVGRTSVLHGRPKGWSVGVVTLHLLRRPYDLTDATEMHQAKQRLAHLERQWKALTEEARTAGTDPLKFYEGQPHKQRQIERIKRQMDSLRETAGSPVQESYFVQDFVSMASHVGDDPEVHALVEAYKNAVSPARASSRDKQR